MIATVAIGVLTNLVTDSSVLPASWTWTSDPVVLFVGFGLAVALAILLALLSVRAAETETESQPPTDRDPHLDLDQDDHAVISLCRAQAAAAETFPYRLLGDHGRDLAEVYVRQQVTDAVGPTVSITVALEQHRHLVVVGQAGSGKSTLAYRLTVSLIGALLDPDAEPGAPVPLRVSARSLASRLEHSFADALAGAVGTEIGGFLDTVLDPAILRRRWRGAPWLLVVDGLDEVVDVARRQELVAVLRRHVSEGDLYRLLITTRSLPEQQMTAMARMPGAGRYEIALFNREQRRAFAEAWFRASPATTAAEFLRQAEQGGLSELIAVPLLATVAAVVFADHPDRGLPHSRYELYERYFSLVYDQRTHTAQQGLTERLRSWPAGEALADWLAANRMPLVDHLAEAALHDADLLPAALDWLRQQNRGLDPEPPDWAAIVAAVAGSTGLLTYVGTDLKFVHQTFAEHRNATRLARTLPAQFNSEHALWSYYLAAARTEPGSGALAVLAHHTFQQGSAHELLDWLLRGDDEGQLLAARLIAEGVPAEPRHFTAVADALRFWTARSTQVDQMAELATRLLKLAAGLPEHPEIVDVLEELLDSPATRPALRIPAARALAAYGDPHLSIAIVAFSLVANDVRLAVDDRLGAIEDLVEHGRSGQATGALRQLSTQRRWLDPDHERRAEQLFGLAAPGELWREPPPIKPVPRPAPAVQFTPWLPAPPPPDPPERIAGRHRKHLPSKAMHGPWDDETDAWFVLPALWPKPLVVPNRKIVVEPRPLPRSARAAVRVIRYLGLWQFDQQWLARHHLTQPSPHRLRDWVRSQVQRRVRHEPQPLAIDEVAPVDLLAQISKGVVGGILLPSAAARLALIIDADPPVEQQLLLNALSDVS